MPFRATEYTDACKRRADLRHFCKTNDHAGENDAGSYAKLYGPYGDRGCGDNDRERGECAKKYDPGASDTEIKIGNIMPYSGPASAYGVIGKAQAAYFNKINAEGGINGRKINFISYDDSFSPPKAVEQAPG
jgi:ABC-type branched-subunit amino acid transport system substrate-binding protein